jgi:hypothetical protein
MDTTRSPGESSAKNVLLIAAYREQSWWPLRLDERMISGESESIGKMGNF